MQLSGSKDAIKLQPFLTELAVGEDAECVGEDSARDAAGKVTKNVTSTYSRPSSEPLAVRVAGDRACCVATESRVGSHQSLGRRDFELEEEAVSRMAVC
jgi:hypothetical protein